MLSGASKKAVAESDALHCLHRLIIPPPPQRTLKAHTDWRRLPCQNNNNPCARPVTRLRHSKWPRGTPARVYLETPGPLFLGSITFVAKRVYPMPVVLSAHLAHAFPLINPPFPTQDSREQALHAHIPLLQSRPFFPTSFSRRRRLAQRELEQDDRRGDRRLWPGA